MMTKSQVYRCDSCYLSNCYPEQFKPFILVLKLFYCHKSDIRTRDHDYFQFYSIRTCWLMGDMKLYNLA